MKDIKMKNTLFNIFEVLICLFNIIISGLPWFSIFILLGGVIWILGMHIGSYIIWSIPIVFAILMTWAKIIKGET
jgi:hypothetical protein